MIRWRPDADDDDVDGDDTCCHSLVEAAVRPRRVLGQLIERALNLPVVVEGDDPPIIRDLLGRRACIAGLATRALTGWVDEQVQAG
jgi:hypothetical protein